MDLIRLAAAAAERPSEEGLKRVNKQAAGHEPAAGENLPLRLRSRWDDSRRVGALQWEEPRAILTGLALAPTEGGTI